MFLAAFLDDNHCLIGNITHGIWIPLTNSIELQWINSNKLKEYLQWQANRMTRTHKSILFQWKAYREKLLQKEGHTKEHSFNFFFHIVAFRVNLNHELFYDSLKEIIRAPINSQNMLVCPICKLKRILISQETKFVIS